MTAKKKEEVVGSSVNTETIIKDMKECLCYKLCFCGGTCSPENCIKRLASTKSNKEKYFGIPFYIVPLLPGTNLSGSEKTGYGFLLYSLPTDPDKMVKEISSGSDFMALMHSLNALPDVKSLIASLPNDVLYKDLIPCREYNDKFFTIALRINELLTKAHGFYQKYFPDFIDYNPK